nr:reverse transcriptase domain-containing protein [Tanacetum cinerariifolium]
MMSCFVPSNSQLYGATSHSGGWLVGLRLVMMYSMGRSDPHTIVGFLASIGPRPTISPRLAPEYMENLKVDFLIEMPGENPQAAPAAETQQEPLTLFTDGSSCVDGSGAVEEDGPTWMTPIVEYLKEGTLPSDKKEARKLHIKARQYELMEGILYRRSFLPPWLRCVGPLQTEYVWIEAKAVATITGSQVKKFVWDNIVCRFGHPGEIVSDNGKQFSDNPFKDWCDKLNITQRFVSVKHPQYNRLVKRANRSLGEGIKARLGEHNKNWVEELPHVLWVHRTMIKSSHGDTPFSLTYRTEAVIPTEIGMPMYRTAAVDANDASHAVAGGKLGPKWEGLYEVTEALGDGAYKLRSMDATILPRTWNIANLKRCYL